MTLLSLAAHAVRGALLFGAALAVLSLLRGASASARRFVLVTAFVAALLVPLAATVAPAWRVGPAVAGGPAITSAPFAEPLTQGDGGPRAVTPEGEAAGRATGARRAWRGPSPVTTAVALWAVGALIVTARLAAALLAARRVVRAAAPLEDPARLAWVEAIVREAGVRVRVLVSDRVGTPAVAGVFAPVVLMPAAALTWTRTRWRLVLLHELAHVAQRDGVAYVLSQLACAVHWFDPLAWVAARRLHVERELAADDRVLAAGVRASTFAEHLVAVAAGATGDRLPRGAFGMARPSQLATRVRALVVAGRARGAISERGVLAVGVLGGAAVLAIACARPSDPAASGAAAPKAPLAAGAHAAEAPGATRDAALQAMAEEETERLVAEWKPTLATVVVLDPSTGAVLAMTSRATDGGHDVALTRATATGSTVKPLVVAAALDEGVITPDDRFSCDPKEGAYAKRGLHDSVGHGTLDVTQILAVSSNVGTSRIYDALGPARLGRRLSAFHFGERIDVGVPDVPPGDYAALTGGDPWAAMLVGIGEGLKATPMQVAAAYAALANGGVYHRPTLVSRPDAGERVVREQTTRTVVRMLEQVVEGEAATGKRARVEGVPVAGKTGTASEADASGKEARYASFVGIVPSDRPRFVILVGAQVTGRDDATGGSVAAPAFARLAARSLGR